MFHFRGRRRLFPLNGVLFTQEILNETILLCMDYDVALELRGFSVSVQAFKEITQILNYYYAKLLLTFNHSAPSCMK